MKEPQTREEWQEAMDGAYALRLLHDARLYGLIEGGPEVDAGRCDEILDRGRAKGFAPRPDALERVLADLLAAGMIEAEPERNVIPIHKARRKAR